MTPPKVPIADAPPASLVIHNPTRVDVYIDYKNRVLKIDVSGQTRVLIYDAIGMFVHRTNPE